MSDFPNFLTYSQISRFLHHCLCYCLPIQQLYPHKLHLYLLHLLINSTILFWMTSYNEEEQGEHPNDFSAASCTPQPSMLQTTLGFLHLSAHQAAEGSAQPYGPISNAIWRFRTRKTHITSPLLLIPSVNQHRIRLASFSFHSFRGMCLSEQPLAVVIKKQQSSSTGATRCFLKELLPDLQISPGNSEMGCRVCIVIVAGLVCSAAVIIPRVSLCCLISQTFERGNVIYSSYKFSQYYGAPSQ